MKQLIIILSSAILLVSCNGKHNEGKKLTGSIDSNVKDAIHQNTPVAGKAIQKASSEADKAREWLIMGIENSLNKAHGNLENPNEDAEEDVKTIYTTQYNAYKIDAINVDLDDGMTEDEFVEKWKGKYNPKLAGVGYGFLVPEQDYGLIKVTHCELKNKTPDGFVFNVLIEDTSNHTKYNRDIKVVNAAKSFLIDDVLEY
ncbi:hypothetical protein AY601_4726 [Pedobacter cryoconitis]|uniref:Lipoprotein n=1 Tax=Pedobacter cryoconitis TaxID=188932 RepID=A0A127VJQ6_9SPHI|nr:hypothetical protein [Pedobacter cryoconitis]AMQ01555.1 hypothetical protein AY601_4726 [Pedobacter cryoconitis]